MAGLAGLALLGAPRVRAELVDRVAAVVNNDVITLSEVEKRAAPELARVDQETTGPERAQKRSVAMKRILDTMIDEKLVDNELKELKVSISDKEVDSAVDEVKKSYNLTDEQLQQAVSKEGYSIAEYREQMRKQIGRYKLISEKVRKNVKVSDADVQSEYDRMTRSEGEDYEVHVRHILIAVPRNASSAQVEQARRKAAAVAEEARGAGVNFAELAKTRSEGSSSADGGDLGFFKRGTMVPEFERVAFNLKTGEVSEPVRTQFGWHVLKLEEIRKLGMKPLAEVRPEIEDRLRRAQAERLTSQYMETPAPPPGRRSSGTPQPAVRGSASRSETLPASVQRS
jgi:peptidyl-prolyl cis-trans isomerase SurA